MYFVMNDFSNIPHRGIHNSTFYPSYLVPQYNSKDRAMCMSALLVCMLHASM